VLGLVGTQGCNSLRADRVTETVGRDTIQRARHADRRVEDRAEPRKALKTGARRRRNQRGLVHGQKSRACRRLIRSWFIVQVARLCEDLARILAITHHRTKMVTGAHSDRRQLLKMLDTLVPGDVVTVTRIDRLARSTFDLFAIVKQIVDAKAQFRSLAEPWADTGTGRLLPCWAAWQTWSAILSAPAQPRAAVGHRSAGNTWTGPRN
jgi:hypothetical protein